MEKMLVVPADPDGETLIITMSRRDLDTIMDAVNISIGTICALPAPFRTEQTESRLRRFESLLLQGRAV